MTSEQAALSDDKSRHEYLENFKKRGFQPPGKRWYADNTREPIRDESLRDGLVRIGAVLQLTGIPTTSGKPRYFLKQDFAALFNPELTGEALLLQMEQWRDNNLSKSALMRLSLAGLAAKDDEDDVLITFPNKETRRLTGGPSSQISKAVIEVFAPNFLEQPAVLWLSTSDDKIRDDKIAASIGLHIEADKNLPDIILVDLAPKDPVLVFIEVVATDGAMTESRKEAIYKITDSAAFNRKQITFVTAYADRQSTGFKKTIRELAWDSFCWFVSEPDKLVHWKHEPTYLSKISNNKY
jgi:hypothetical protein